MLRPLLISFFAATLFFGVVADLTAQTPAPKALASPHWRRPSVEGADEARAVVRQALQARGDRVAARTWMARGRRPGRGSRHGSPPDAPDRRVLHDPRAAPF